MIYWAITAYCITKLIPNFFHSITVNILWTHLKDRKTELPPFDPVLPLFAVHKELRFLAISAFLYMANFSATGCDVILQSVITLTQYLGSLKNLYHLIKNGLQDHSSSSHRDCINPFFIYSIRALQVFSSLKLEFCFLFHLQTVSEESQLYSLSVCSFMYTNFAPLPHSSRANR